MSTLTRVSHSENLAKQILDQYLGNFKKLDNVRPEWLNGLEIDRLYPTLGVAIEFQGDQHYRTVPGMHKGPEDFRRQIANDTQKAQAVSQKGMKLYAINLYDLDRFRVKNLIKKMVGDGKAFAQANGYKTEVLKLNNIRWDQEPDERLMRRSDKMGKMRKSYYKPNRKSWWRKLLGV